MSRDCGRFVSVMRGKAFFFFYEILKSVVCACISSWSVCFHSSLAVPNSSCSAGPPPSASVGVQVAFVPWFRGPSFRCLPGKQWWLGLDKRVFLAEGMGSGCFTLVPAVHGRSYCSNRAHAVGLTSDNRPEVARMAHEHCKNTETS